MIPFRGRIPPSVGAFLACLLAACAGNPHRGPVPPLPGRFEGLGAEYRLTWRDGGAMRKGRLVAALRPPHHVRLELLDSLGASRAVLAATEEGAILLDSAGRTFRRFASGTDAFEAVSGMKIPVESLSALLLGDPSMTPEWSCLPAQETGGPGRICSGPGEDPVVTVLSDGEWKLEAAGDASLRVELGFPGAPGTGPPDWIRVQGASGGPSVELFLREMHFGPPGDDLFALEPPPSFREASPEGDGPWILEGKP